MKWAETPATLARARAEQAVTFAGAQGFLSGIFTPPAPDAEPAGPCVIFPGRPRFGSRRGSVLAARTLAAEGFACFRFDLRGSGESAGEPAMPSRQQPYGDDVVAAIRYLKEAHRQKRFVLVGYCFDALCVLDAFRYDAGAVEGLFFAAAPVADERADTVSPPRVRRGIGAIPAVIRNWISPAEAPRRQRISKNFDASFRALVRSGARALFIYGEDDYLGREFEIAQERLFARLEPQARSRLAVEVWPGRAHSLQRKAIFDRAVSWVREFHPGTEAPQTRPAQFEPARSRALSR